jgi:hypothetical protein
MLSSHGAWDTGAKKREDSQTSQSQIKDKDPKAKSMVSIKASSSHSFSGIMFWMEKYEGANETKYLDIFTCSRILIPVNIKLKHWILACIDFEQKWIPWLDSIGDTYEQETRILFAWLTREHSVNRSSVFEKVREKNGDGEFEKARVDAGP